MNQLSLPIDQESLIKSKFSESGIIIRSIDRRDYPGETIFVVQVEETDFDSAANLGNRIDKDLDELGIKGFVAVRKAESTLVSPTTRLKRGVAEPLVNKLTNLLTARSRTSEVQPSLSYIPDAANNLQLTIAPRHHLIFGRRGAGKTALMVESKRVIDKQGHQSIWINLQTLRHASAQRAYVIVCMRICELVQAYYNQKEKAPEVLVTATTLYRELEKLSFADELEGKAERIIPLIQRLIRRFLDSIGTRLYIFIDEVHYLPIAEQPRLLDMIHGSVRECDAWLKIAGIKHLSRWYLAYPPLGLQTGHDADIIDLDITLEDPLRAKNFLEQVVKSYVNHAGISSLASIFSNESLDRLLIASGAVPRDYLVLGAQSISQAQQREKSRLVGVQDVNKAAGNAAKYKKNELEDDAASLEGTPQKILSALDRVRGFCIDEKSFTFFRIDFRDKESHPTEYNLVQELLDMRLVHIIDSSLSDEREPGRRSEVYMLDLSQFSGHRLKRRLKVLDFESGHLVIKETGTATPAKIANTPKERVGLLRRGPLFELKSLS